MENSPVLVCTEYYCPDCGSEIFCRIMPNNNLRFYLSRDGDGSIERCPDCQMTLPEQSGQEFINSQRNKKKTSGSKRNTVGKKELARTLKKIKPAEFSSMAAADRALDAIGDTLVEIISSGENIRWPGIGTFRLKERKARRVRNPQTGAMMDVPAKMGVTFVPARRLKALIEDRVK